MFKVILGKPQFFHFVKNDRLTSVLCSFGGAVLVEVEIERNEELAVNLCIVRHCVSYKTSDVSVRCNLIFVSINMCNMLQISHFKEIPHGDPL